MKVEAETTSRRSLSRIFRKLKGALAFARLRGGSLAGAVRIFYHSGLKPPLVYRGLRAFAAGQILRIPFRVSNDEVWKVCLRDNGLDVLTLAEFFSPEAFIGKEFPDHSPAVIYDIGANIGASSLFFGARYPRAMIYGFEPLPSNYEICSMNYQNLNRAQSFPWALGSSSGEVVFEFEPSDNRGGHLAASSSGVSVPASQQSILVQMFTIADLIRDKHLAPPELLKIDVEGAELEVLKGIGEQAGSIRAIHLETHGPEIRAECLRWLQHNGFSILGEREELPGYGSVWCGRD